jgi:hypothetical protein
VLIYGDQEQAYEPAALVDRIRRACDAATHAAGIVGHGLLVSALIDAGMLLQGIADLDRDVRGADGPSPAQDAASALLGALASAVWSSWREGLRAAAPDRLGALLRSVLESAPAARLHCRIPEGFAHYAV